MDVFEIYNEVLKIVEANYQKGLSNVKYKAKDMIISGASPKDVEKFEAKENRSLLLDFKAYTKIGIVVEIFVRSNYSLSDAQIAEIISSARDVHDEIPSLERSSVGRYLTDERISELYTDEIYRTILQKRKDNLLAAKSKGGRAYAENNVPLFDEDGKFIGSQHR